jgi:hypothetical protein
MELHHLQIVGSSIGLLIMAAGGYWMSQMNLDISPGQVVWPRVVLVVGLSICFRPRERSGLPLYSHGAPGSGCRLAQSAAQRRRQRRDVDGTDGARAGAVNRVGFWPDQLIICGGRRNCPSRNRSGNWPRGDPHVMASVDQCKTERGQILAAPEAARHRERK